MPLSRLPRDQASIDHLVPEVMQAAIGYAVVDPATQARLEQQARNALASGATPEQAVAAVQHNYREGGAQNRGTGTGSLPTGGATPPDIPVSDLVAAYMDMGFSYEEAAQIVSEDPLGAMEILQGGGVGASGSGGGGGGVDNSLGYAQLGESQRQFDTEFNEGVRQFDLQYSRNNFESDRAYEQAKYEYATSFAEQQRQFDLGYGLDSRSLDLQTELGRGNLALGQDRLALDSELGRGELQLGRDRLGLDTELGRGYLANDTRRLDLDTELGRGRLALDTELGRGELDLGNRRLALDDRLGTGRLNLDTELGRGQLGVNQQAEQRLQRAQVASERLANRDQELQRTQFVTDVLRKPSDFLARAFLQRGGTSPTGMVTQADIINNLKSSINQFAQGGATTDEVFTTGEQGGAKSTEMLFNPTGAPITILNPDQTQDVMQATGMQPQRYEEGTLGKRKGGLIGRLQEVMEEIEGMGGGLTFNADVKLDTDMIDDQRPGKGGKKKKGKISFDPELLKLILKGQENELGKLGAQGRSTGNAPTRGDERGPISVPGYANGTLPDWYSNTSMQPGSTPDWNAAHQATRSTVDQMRIPNVTQQELVNVGLGALPPAAKSALFGGAGDIAAARPTANLTLGRIARLTPGEQEALNTQLGVQFNTDLQNEIALLQERFGPVVDRMRGRLIPQ